MSDINHILKTVGSAATIVRTAGDIATYCYIDTKIKNTSFNTMPFEREAMLQTDSDVVEGDLIQVGSDYYLAISIRKDERAGSFWVNRARLFKCNHTVTVREFNDTTKAFGSAGASIPCLLVSQSDRMRIATDRGVVLPTYKGQDADYGLFVQATSGIDKNSKMLDENNYPLSVCGGINPYFVKGLLDVPVRIDRP